jgi:DNA-binding response OmpR family regulator
LTPKEYDLAVILFRNLGRLMSRGHLQESVWGRSGDLGDTHGRYARQPGAQETGFAAGSGFRVVPVYNYGYRLEQCEPAT